MTKINEEKKNFGYIQVTRKCNQECLFCSNPYVDDTLSLEEAKKQIDYYVDKCKVNEIILSGGEPTLNEQLKEIVKYAVKKGAQPRIITNAQKLADEHFLKELIDAGLQNYMVSIYSHIESIHDKLTTKEGSLRNTIKALENLSKHISAININMTLNALNIKTLKESTEFFINKFPKIRHFVFNNLDFTGRAKNNPWTVPKLTAVEMPLHNTLVYLQSVGRTFRVERVPLCYLAGFEEYSTETRRIVKEQAYRCLFLDKDGRRLLEKTNDFYYVKTEACNACGLNSICAGLNERYISLNGSNELYPVFSKPEEIIQRINNNKK
jgi:MoaA/NifB/PqqE/SkfB family radical SAM enzyme